MDAGDSTDKAQRLLDELQALRRMLGDEVADRISPQDIPILSDIVIDTPECGPLDSESDPDVEPVHPAEPAPPGHDQPLENIDEAAIQDHVRPDRVSPDRVSPDRVAPDPASLPVRDASCAGQPQIEELIEELVDEWLPVLENALRERLQQLTEAELRRLR